MKHPTLVIFAGVNGSGKSTFYHSGGWRDERIPDNMRRINPDDILREQGWDWSSRADQIKAGKIAIKRIEECLEKRWSFNQETTLSGHLSMRTIRRAHENGYRVFLYFIGVQTPAIALERIDHRVSAGGHDIDEASVQHRFRASIANLSKAVRLCEEAQIIDNTLSFKRIATWHNGTLHWWGVSPLAGSWLIEAMTDPELW